MVVKCVIWAFVIGVLSGCVSAERNTTDKYPIPFELNRSWGAKDKNGVVVIPPIYKNVLLFKGGISAARVGEKIGYIDQRGKIAIPFKYDRGLNLNSGLVGVCAEGKCGYLDAKGNVVIPFLYKEIDYFRQEQGNLAVVQGERGWVIINTAGREIIGPTFGSKPSISEGFIVAFKGKRDGMIYDLKGNPVTPLNYDQIAYNVWAGRYLNDNLFTVAIDGRWGFIDKSGKVIIPPRYDKRGFFFEGYADLVRDGKVYRVDKHGKEELMGDWQRPIP
ncbi:KWG Leptospira family protein [Pseudomonas reidholzensis]|uniref:KWG Leptospira family protein n=1 Tax=Pseudomonas reidholzensis TaxID=1785162 RepID=A0A383RRB1_9PSED|nr:WG repeat-containing protein [Pseudomonas reidholzensis]SYX89599.1 KWG Leptospira family protein [Pseudomonas reidholzensis]